MLEYVLDMLDDFGSYIAQQLENNGWSMRELARRASLSPTSVSYVVNGRVKPTAEFCRSIARALNLPPEGVFRKAGLLPPKPEETAEIDEANYLFSQLSREEQRRLLIMMRALVEERVSTSHPRRKPADTT